MNRRRWLVVPPAVWAAFVLVLSGCAGETGVSRAAADAEAPAAPPAAVAKAAEPRADAKAILMGMARFLSQTPRFSVSMRNGYDTVQASGQKLEFNEVRKVTVSRPDRLRVEVEQSDGDKHLVLFDGKEITVFSTPQNVYAQVAKPGNIDDAVAYFVRDLHMRLPLALLFVNQLPNELERRVQSLDYVEKTSILGVPSHQLAGRTETVDFQVWVTEGSRPLPLRIVLTYKNAEGQPQFWAQFADWNLAPEVTEAMFAFTAPQGVQKIAFLTQLHQVAPGRTETPAKTGGQK